MDAAITMIRELRPHRVILNGDVCDFFQLSRFFKGNREDTLQEEIDEANEIRRRIREAAPDCVFDETEGNHDNRLLSYVIANAKSLSSLRALKPEALLAAKELGIRRHPGAGLLLRRHFLVKHGDLVRADAMATAKAELKKARVSGISGHTHRMGTYREVGYQKTQWTEQGCLCRVDPDYIVGPPNWTQGCAVIELSTRTESFVVHEVPYVDGELRFGSQRF